MPSPVLLPFVEHFDFSAVPLVQVREAFARVEGSTRAIYAGVQWDKWHGDEFVWSERGGRWSGFMPEPKEEEWAIQNAQQLRTVAAELSLIGAVMEEFVLPDDFARGGASEPLLRVASGATLVARSGLNYASESPVDYLPSAATEWLLFNCASGSVAAVAGKDGQLGSAQDGSYELWASAGNEYSAVRVEIGSGEWAWNSAIYPGPGCPLLRKTGAATATITGDGAGFAVPFDPLARVVSASCVLHTDIRTKAGQLDLAAGSLIIAGIRAGRGGPMSAAWTLRADGSSRLLACSKTFSDGRCECAKTVHFASDIQQHPDGRLFILGECDCTVYDPDAPTIWERFTPFPTESDGHPGGNSIRFPNGEICFWTENFGGVNDGQAHYNRLVRRVAGRDASGPSTLWHGPCCAETFLGRYFAIRCDEDKATLEGEGGTLFLDWLDGGRWHGYAGMARATKAVYWQRLRAALGALFVFGFKPSDPEGSESPVCAVADGVTLRDAHFPFFIRRATPSSGALFVCARSGEDGIGAANRVVEIVSRETRFCSFWNASDGAFEMDQAAFVAAGGDVAKLPLFFHWSPERGRSGGGVWEAATFAGVNGPFLRTIERDGALVFELAGAAMPYDPVIWGELCFEILADGSVRGPFIEPTCQDAACALAAMPDGTRFRPLERATPGATGPQHAVQVTDRSDAQRLGRDRELYPTIWLRRDAASPANDLASYTQLVSFGRFEPLEEPAKTNVQLVVLVPLSSAPLRADELPALSRRA